MITSLFGALVVFAAFLLGVRVGIAIGYRAGRKR
jgi:hypothetical protein